MLYFFAKKPGEGAVAALHEGYKRKESGRTGLPILREEVRATWLVRVGQRTVPRSRHGDQ